MNTKDLEYFKAKLVAEKTDLEEELSGIARKDKSSASGWDATSGDIKIDPADDNEVADKLEELEENNGIASKLEEQLKEVRDALSRIEKGIYGLDETTNEPIQRERLEANPSARTAIKHKN